jgi:hypothetical protein
MISRFLLTLLAATLLFTQNSKGASGDTAFDGAWTVTINFHAWTNPDGTEAKAFTRSFPATVKNGVFYGESGTKGKPNWYSLGGKIQADGSADLTVNGKTGDAGYTPTHPEPGGPVHYQVLAHFSGRQGTGHSVGDPPPPHAPRTRIYTFTKV